jgi:hypothetical protein
MAPGDFVRGLEGFVLLAEDDLIVEEAALLGETPASWWTEGDEEGRVFLGLVSRSAGMGLGSSALPLETGKPVPTSS